MRDEGFSDFLINYFVVMGHTVEGVTFLVLGTRDLLLEYFVQRETLVHLLFTGK